MSLNIHQLLVQSTRDWEYILQYFIYNKSYTSKGIINNANCSNISGGNKINISNSSSRTSSSIGDDSGDNFSLTRQLFLLYILCNHIILPKIIGDVDTMSARSGSMSINYLDELFIDDDNGGSSGGNIGNGSTEMVIESPLPPLSFRQSKTLSSNGKLFHMLVEMASKIFSCIINQHNPQHYSSSSVTTTSVRQPSLSPNISTISTTTNHSTSTTTNATATTSSINNTSAIFRHNRLPMLYIAYKSYNLINTNDMGK